MAHDLRFGADDSGRASFLRAGAVPGERVAPQDATTIGDRLMADAAIRKVVEGVQRDEPYVIEQQMRLCEIPAPPFGESARAAAYQAGVRSGSA